MALRNDAKNGKSEQASERRRRVFAMKVEHKSNCEIARLEGVSEAQVRKDIKRVLAELTAETKALATDWRTYELACLDMALKAIARKVHHGDLFAIDRWVRLLESRRRLTGTDMPQKLAPTTPDGSEPYDDTSDDKRIARLAALFDAARARRGGQADGGDSSTDVEAAAGASDAGLSQSGG